jgi:hypothetical protein
MGHYFRHALKTFTTLPGQQNTAQSQFFSGLLKAGPKAVTTASKKSADLKRHFKTSFDASKVSFVAKMKAYIIKSPVRLYTSHNDKDDNRLIPTHHMPQHGDINALARVIVLMSEPAVLLPFIPSIARAVSIMRVIGTGLVAENCQRGQVQASG